LLRILYLHLACHYTIENYQARFATAGRSKIQRTLWFFYRPHLTSEDGSHGFSIDKTEWTPDSQFLFFSTYSSVGHQTWQTPTLFFDRRDSKIHGFEEFLAPIAEGDFELKSPDIISITILTPVTPEKTLDDSIQLRVTFKMRDLTPEKNKTKR
jgi:hypothetical protein